MGDNRLGEFLRARREQAAVPVGLPTGLGKRRVPGLRREEVALLAGVSTDYYVRLEQGRDTHPSDQVLEALARVLDLDESSTVHLYALVRPAPARRRPAARPERVSTGLLRIMEGMAAVPAKVLSRHFDVLAANAMAQAVHPAFRPGTNMIRYAFLEPHGWDMYPDRERVAADMVAVLRGVAGADRDDPRLTELVGELCLKSEEFRRLWAKHGVRVKTAGLKRFRHPMVGEFDLEYESLTINGADGQLLVCYHAEPHSPGADALALLSALVATEAANA
ncbi:transcriptional regulator [Virgisporangium aliadipatigenens]|uniref:Transcriptional regulator n=1 Tax=Virgisporangium aliadipatigenens TaxID=741659 RepID=A0A8J3YUZ8_9ACTN|nr:helix-turn-helix transcriptional regulator [Virgisporangium aliadipatigenens]GIJ50992.1 transcriptional regulator [Virgisporangium aliadipatigenens]